VCREWLNINIPAFRHEPATMLRVNAPSGITAP
jgi:hypothetical protein